MLHATLGVLVFFSTAWGLDCTALLKALQAQILSQGNPIRFP
jgi:hypothetical protein